MHHRREIDGLRALAVVPVILFHAGVGAVPGGYVGVDVFFVISGYLITAIVLEERARGTFALGAFWERRARRILPALFVVAAACLPPAWAWLLPSDLFDFGRSLVAVSAFASNLLFWRGSGYFDPAAELQPLLHTWSLAVEEQFYLLYPLALAFAWRFGRVRLPWLLALAAVASFAVAQWASIHRPAAAFFLLPARAWELLLGALLAATIARRGAPRTGPLAAEAGALAGIALIAAAVLGLDASTPMPGAWALLPTVGTVLVLAFATPATFVGRALGHPLPVGLGLVSYGAYLWHQPLLAFARQRAWDEPEATTVAALVVASFVLAAITWHVVERPFRDRRAIGRRTVVATAVAGTLGLAAAGAALVQRGGFVERFAPEQQALLRLAATPWRDALAPYGLGTCFLDDPQTVETLLRERCVSPAGTARRVLVLGDSEAAHLMAGVRRHFGGDGWTVDQWTATECAPIRHAAESRRCADVREAFAARVAPTLRPGDRVIVAANWIDLHARDGDARFAAALRETFAALARTGATVVVAGDVPEFARPPIETAVKRGIVPGDAPVVLASRDFRAASAIVRDEALRAGLRWFDVAARLCERGDPASCRVAEGREWAFVDRRHLGVAASERLVGALHAALRDEAPADARAAGTSPAGVPPDAPPSTAAPRTVPPPSASADPPTAAR